MSLARQVKTFIHSQKPEGHKQDGSRYYRCPFCKGRKKLEVDARKPVWYCHKCGLGGTLDERRRQRYEDQSIYASLCDLDKFDLTKDFQPLKPDGVLWKYLSGERGLSRSLIKSMRPHKGPSPARVYFPFYELGGVRPIYFVGRSVLPCFLRYWNPSVDDFPHKKSTVLWGLHRIQRPLERILICEGIFDACHALDRVAVLGKTISDAQVEIIKDICQKEVVVCLDGDADARSIASKLAANTCFDISIVRLPADKDPDNLRNIDYWIKRRERFV